MSGRKRSLKGLPWQSSGQDSVFHCRQLGLICGYETTHKPCGVAKKVPKQQQQKPPKFLKIEIFFN